jgi:hypothetical protein
MIIFSIGGLAETDRLEVETEGNCPSIVLDDWRPVGVRVKINTQGLAADVAISIFPAELLRFEEALKPVYRDVRGSAEFTTLEQQLAIKVEIDKLGHVTATGFLKGDIGGSNQLRFTLNYDQTLLWHTISEIDEFLFAAVKDRKS